MDLGALAQEIPLTLTGVELYDLTHKKRPAAQVRALRSMGLEHRRRPDGTVAVLREHVFELMGGKKAAKRMREEGSWEINWED